MTRSIGDTQTNRSRKPRWRVPPLLAISALLLAAASYGRVAIAGNLDKVELFDISAQSLDKALLEFGMQAHVQIMFEWSPITSKLRSPRIKGRYTARQALSVLLEGTQLDYAEHGNTVTIVRDAPPGLAGTKTHAKKATATTVREDKLTKSAIKGGSEVLSEITVTGTYLRGTVPVGSPVMVYSRETIDESGAATIGEFARQIPENFSGADSLTSGLGGASQEAIFDQTGGNVFGGAAFNLNGIGPTATLTLLNGQRLAPAGLTGSFVDVSLIPLSAVERIEILPDGASAIYGSDAVAGVVNIITRKDFQGASTSVRYGTATAGGADEVTASQLLGKSWSSGNVMMAYEYNGQAGLDASRRAFIPSQGGPYSIVPPTWRNSLFVSGRQNIGDDTSLSGDAIYSTRRAHSEFTILPTGEFEFYDNRERATQSGISITLHRALVRDWSIDVTGSYSRLQQLSSGLAAFDFGGGFDIADTSIVRTNTSLAGFNLLAQGSVVDLPGGEIKAAVGASIQGERFINDTATVGTDNVAEPEDDFRRHMASVYGELVVPIIGISNSVALAHRLAVSLAAREDRYSDFGTTTNPKVGLVWSPFAGLNLRATYGTSYRAPLLSQVASPVTYVAEEFPDPASVSGLTDTLYISGGNRGLRPERSRSFSVGPDLEVNGLSAGATYSHIHYTDRVGTPPIASLLTVLVDPVDASFVTRAPSPAAVNAAFNSPGFQGDYAGLGPPGVGAIFDSRDTNLAATTQSSVDLRVAYRIASSSGLWMPSVAADHQIQNRLRATPSSATVELLDLYGEPVRWKIHGGVSWTKAPFGAALSLNYLSRYHDQFTAPYSGISSWTTADIHLSYRTPDTAGFGIFRGLTVALTVENITDEKPPYVAIPPAVTGGAAPIPYDPANASPVGRLLMLQVNKQWTR